MEFTTVRSKEKDYDIYLKSEKLVHSQQEHEKNVSQLFGCGKNWFLAISSLTNTVAAIWRVKKVDPCYLGNPKMQFTTVRSKEIEYDIYIKSEKLVHSQQEHEKSVSQVFGNGKNWFLAISSLTNTVAAIWRVKNVDHCYLGNQKMQFTTVRSKEKDYDIYIKSEKLVQSQQEHENSVSQLFGSGKNWFLAILSLTNSVAAIWREKKVDPCYLKTKKCSLQLLGAMKKIMTSL